MCINCGYVCGKVEKKECVYVDQFSLRGKKVSGWKGELFTTRMLSTIYPQIYSHKMTLFSTQKKPANISSGRTSCPVIHFSTITTAYLYL